MSVLVVGYLNRDPKNVLARKLLNGVAAVSERASQSRRDAAHLILLQNGYEVVSKFVFDLRPVPNLLAATSDKGMYVLSYETIANL